MTAGDIDILSGSLGRFDFLADDRTTTSETATMKPGEPVKKGSVGNVIALDDGEPVTGTDVFVGICAEESTETSTADGRCEVDVVTGGTVLEGKATTVTNIDTQSELDALMLSFVSFDATASSGENGIYTIDENETDDPNGLGLCLVGGDITKGTLKALVHGLCTATDSIVGQTMD